MSQPAIVLAAPYVPGSGYILTNPLAPVLQGLDVVPGQCTLSSRDNLSRTTTYAVAGAGGSRIALSGVLSGIDQPYRAGDLVVLQLGGAAIPATGLEIAQHYGPIGAGTPGATITFNLATNDTWQVQLGANSAIAVANPTVGQQFTAIIQQAAAGGPYSVTSWLAGSTVIWLGAPYTAPTMPVTAGAYLTCTFRTIGAGVYLAWWLGNSAA